jgi:hypothetical protein
VSISSSGAMLGDEDAMALQNYSKTAKCLSMTADVLYMDVTDFFQRIKFNEETWEYL